MGLRKKRRKTDSNKLNISLGCRQAVRHETLTLARVGSNPATPAKFNPLAEAHSAGGDFNFGVSPSGKAWDSDSHIRGFESFRPSQSKKFNCAAYFTYCAG